MAWHAAILDFADQIAAPAGPAGAPVAMAAAHLAGAFRDRRAADPSTLVSETPCDAAEVNRLGGDRDGFPR